MSFDHPFSQLRNHMGKFSQLMGRGDRTMFEKVQKLTYLILQEDSNTRNDPWNPFRCHRANPSRVEFLYIGYDKFRFPLTRSISGANGAGNRTIGSQPDMLSTSCVAQFRRMICVYYSTNSSTKPVWWNTRFSIRDNLDLDSNGIEESDLHKEKHYSPKTLISVPEMKPILRSQSQPIWEDLRINRINWDNHLSPLCSPNSNTLRQCAFTSLPCGSYFLLHLHSYSRHWQRFLSTGVTLSRSNYSTNHNARWNANWMEIGLWQETQATALPEKHLDSEPLRHLWKTTIKKWGRHRWKLRFSCCSLFGLGQHPISKIWCYHEAAAESWLPESMRCQNRHLRWYCSRWKSSKQARMPKFNVMFPRRFQKVFWFLRRNHIWGHVLPTRCNACDDCDLPWVRVDFILNYLTWLSSPVGTKAFFELRSSPSEAPTPSRLTSRSWPQPYNCSK
jgi:hypothetical protein